ncbi:MAG: hypothetical protein AAF125_22735, partial [Chloroflexota bacterium]
MHLKAALFPVLIGALFGTLQMPATSANTSNTIYNWAAYFENSTLSEAERIAELTWFAEVAQPFRGYTIRSVAEDIETHYWEREVLAPIFEEITGIRVQHEIIGEGSVVERLVEQQQTGRLLYDIYVNDADLIGTHTRTEAVVNLTEYMADEGAPYTNPYLDLNDNLMLDANPRDLLKYRGEDFAL